MTLFSMITPVFNGAKTLAETIASVRAQHYHPLEYIVVDALSTDATTDIIAANRDLVTKHIREADRGIYDAMNKGIKHAHGDMIGIINADDLLEVDALQQVAAAFADTDADYVCGDLTIMDEAGHAIGRQTAQSRWITGERNPLGRDWRMNIGLLHPSLFVRRRVYEKLGQFDLRFRLAADHDFIARMIADRRHGVYLGQPLARFRLGGTSSNSLIECFREDEIIGRKHGVHPVLARLIRLRKSHYARRHAALDEDPSRWLR